MSRVPDPWTHITALSAAAYEAAQAQQAELEAAVTALDAEIPLISSLKHDYKKVIAGSMTANIDREMFNILSGHTTTAAAPAPTITAAEIVEQIRSASKEMRRLSELAPEPTLAVIPESWRERALAAGMVERVDFVVGAPFLFDYGQDQGTAYVLVLGKQSLMMNGLDRAPRWREDDDRLLRIRAPEPGEPKLSRQAKRLAHRAKREKHRPGYLDIKGRRK